MPLRLTLLGGAHSSERMRGVVHNLKKGPFAGAEVVAEEEPHTRDVLRRLAREPRQNRAVLELSPLADPRRLKQSFAADRDLSNMIVGETLMVLDASQGASPLIDERPLRIQAIGADAMILARLEASVDTQLVSLIATLRLINPGAELYGALRDQEADLPRDGPVRPLLPPDLDEPCAAAVLSLDENADWTAFSLWFSATLHARGPDILRVRAWARTPTGGLLVHGANGAMFAPEVFYGAAPGAGEAVILGRGFTAVELAKSFERFAGL